MKEIWKKSPLLPCHFEVSNLGRARTLDHGTPTKTGKLRWFEGSVLSPSKCTNGYLFIHYWEPNRKLHKSVLMHRAVATAFIPNRKKKPQINHKDGDRSNNAASNLSWVSCSQNHFHRSRVLGGNRGSLNPATKLSESDVLEILELLDHPSQNLAAMGRCYGVSTGTIWDIKAGKTWAHLADTRREILRKIHAK